MSHQKRRTRCESLLQTIITHDAFFHCLHIFMFLNLQVYKDRDVYVKEWKKRKRLVMNFHYCQMFNITACHFFLFPLVVKAVLSEVIVCLCQASDMINAILEGYPKSKKEFLVGGSSANIYFTTCKDLINTSGLSPLFRKKLE